MCADWVNKWVRVSFSQNNVCVCVLGMLLASVRAGKNIKHGVLGEKTNGLSLIQSVLYMYYFILSADGEYKM